jgi:hypothetical protein
MQKRRLHRRVKPRRIRNQESQRHRPPDSAIAGKLSHCQRVPNNSGCDPKIDPGHRQRRDDEQSQQRPVLLQLQFPLRPCLCNRQPPSTNFPNHKPQQIAGSKQDRGQGIAQDMAQLESERQHEKQDAQQQESQ